MRLKLNEYLNENRNELKDKIRFLHNDLWSFDSKDLDFVSDLKNAENAIWGWAYGIWKQGLFPVIYGVSFFEIGRLEQLRKFFGFNKAPILIFNAGRVGYNVYGWEHSFKFNDDKKILKALNFKVYNSENIEIQKIFEKLFQKKNIYIRLGKDEK